MKQNVEHAAHPEGHLRGSRLITGTILLAGTGILGIGVGLALGLPGFGMVIGVGVWFTLIGLARIARGL